MRHEMNRVIHCNANDQWRDQQGIGIQRNTRRPIRPNPSSAGIMFRIIAMIPPWKEPSVMIMMTLMTAMAKVKLENCELATSSAAHQQRHRAGQVDFQFRKLRFERPEYLIDLL